MFGSVPIIYAPEDMEGVAIRFKQQVNENAKNPAWVGVIPEMNHNELVGWYEPWANFTIILLKNNHEFTNRQITLRFKIMKDILSTNQSLVEIETKGKSLFEQSFYHIHLEDWVSYYLALLNGVEPMQIDVIGYLKKELVKIEKHPDTVVLHKGIFRSFSL